MDPALKLLIWIGVNALSGSLILLAVIFTGTINGTKNSRIKRLKREQYDTEIDRTLKAYSKVGFGVWSVLVLINLLFVLRF